MAVGREGWGMAVRERGGAWQWGGEEWGMAVGRRGVGHGGGEQFTHVLHRFSRVSTYKARLKAIVCVRPLLSRLVRLGDVNFDR